MREFLIYTDGNFTGFLFLGGSVFCLLMAVIFARIEKPDCFFKTCLTFDDKEYQGFIQGYWWCAWFFAILGAFLIAVYYYDFRADTLPFVLSFVGCFVAIYIVSRILLLIIILWQKFLNR